MGAMRAVEISAKPGTDEPQGVQPKSSGPGRRPAIKTERANAMGYLIVFLGGGFGAALRHGMNLLAARLFPGLGFPLATLVINVTGSIVMGVLVAIFAFKGGGTQHWRLFLTTGILGGYTTFSTFSLDFALLYERGDLVQAALYVVGSVVLSIFGILLAMALTRYVL
jgi:CrcB protein